MVVDVQLIRTLNVNVKITSHSYSTDSNKAECAKFVLQFDSPLQNGMNEDGMNERKSRNKRLSSPQMLSFCGAELLLKDGNVIRKNRVFY